MELQGQVAIVTGGSRGYGAGIAEVLAEAGIHVWITGRDEAALEKTASRLSVRSIRADVASPTDWDRVMDTVLAEHGTLDILVNNAGAGGTIAPADILQDEAIFSTINVNLTGAILGAARAAAILKVKQAGTIINISSVCGRYAWPGWSIYSAAKAGLEQFSRCLYAEMRPYGVRVSTLIPSWGATDFLAAANLEARPVHLNDACIQPREIGELVLSICKTPIHLAVPEVMLLPLVQEIVPL